MTKIENSNPEELRFNYLGFDYVPGRIKEFWESEAERKKYLEKIQQQAAAGSRPERDFSIVNAGQLGKSDRLMISLGSVVLILSLILPYYSFTAYGKQVSGIAIGFLLNLGYVGNFVAWGNLAMKSTLVLAVLLIFVSPIVGIINLIALNGDRTKENYYKKVKSASRLNLYALLLYFLLLVLVISSQPNPFGSLGISALGESFNLGSFIRMAGFGIWLNIGAHLLGMIPALEL